jgi:hypothetical protein
MLDPSNYPDSHEFATVEKTVEIAIGSPQRRYRVEALHNLKTGTVTTRVQVQVFVEDVHVSRWGADAKEQKEDRGALVWIVFPTRMQSPIGLTVDDAINYEIAHLPD